MKTAFRLSVLAMIIGVQWADFLTQLKKLGFLQQ